MAKTEKLQVLTETLVVNKIYIVRGQKVMLDDDLAELYNVQTKVLNQSVKRNSFRFPEDFMFQVTKEEYENLKSQFVTSSWGGRRKLPNAFTEQGVAMLSSVLNSETAIRVNIQIIRVFTKMREVMLTNKEILLQLEKIERNWRSTMKISCSFLNTSSNCSTRPNHPVQKWAFAEKMRKNNC